MKKLLLTLLFLVMIQVTVFSQSVVSQIIDNCGGVTPTDSNVSRTSNCSRASTSWYSKYRKQETYIPGVSDAVKTVHCRIIVWQQDGGGGTWDENNPSDITRLQSMIDLVNLFWSNTQGPSDPLPGVTPLGYSNIQFDIGLKFYQNSTLYNHPDCWNFNELNTAAIAEDPTNADYLLIHLVGCTCNAGGCTDHTGTYNFNGTSTVMTSNHGAPTDDWDDARNIAHELGHVMGYMHLYNGTGSDEEPCNSSNIDFLDDAMAPSGTNGCSPVGSCTHCWDPGGSCNPYLSSTDLCDNNLMGGSTDYKYLSPKQIGRAHRNLAITNVSRYATGYSSNPWVVNQNETWDFEIKFYQDIVIEPGNTLTIKCTVHMVDGAKIIVKQGAKLIVDGGTITNGGNPFPGCNGLWEGIEVWGDKTKNQFPSAGNYEQGYLELKNDAILENCREAIRLYRVHDLNTTGGIVKASNSTIQNVRRGVEFLAYQNYKIGGSLSNPADFRPNASYFDNCTFLITDNLPGNTPFYGFITMWGVDGVRVRGCTFQNNNPNVTDITQLGNGIYTIDANFNVYEICSTIPPLGSPCPLANSDKNEFINLRAGVWATKATGIYKYSVRNSLFTNNQIGIMNNGVSNSWLTDNEFTIGNTPSALVNTPQVGINLANNILGFKVENNKMTEASTPSGPDVSVGIWSYNTGTNNNSIYGNTLNSMDYGLLNEKLNRQAVNDPWATGLQLRCNKIVTSGIDIIVRYVNPGGDPNSAFYGIKPSQGSLSDPAGNQFSNNSDYVNDEYNNYTGYYGLTYFYRPSIPVEYPNDVLNVTRISSTSTPSTFCAPTYGYGSTFIIGSTDIALSPATNKSQAIQDFISADASYNTYLKLLKNTIDGGSTQNKKDEVANAAIGETMILRSKLLQDSPFLSEEVLKDASDRIDVLPEAILFEVLQANPHAIKSNTLEQHLKEKTKPLPLWMVEFLKANSGQITYLTMLSSLVNHYDIQRTEAIYNIVDHLLVDTPTVNQPELRRWLAELKNPQADYLIVQSFLNEGDISSAQSFLNTIEKNYVLDSYMQQDYQNFKTLFGFYEAVKQDLRDWASLNSIEINTLAKFADGSEYTGSNIAKNVLNFFYGYNYWIEPDLKNTTSVPKNAKIQNPLSENKMSVYPNPGNDWVIFEYNLVKYSEKITIVVSDQMGKIINTQSMPPGYIGTFVLDTREWTSGIYIYQLICDGQTIKNDKLVIAH